MMTMEPQNAHRIAENYLAVWNEPDRSTRLRKLETTWTADATYSDPLMHGRTPAGLADMIEAARSQFPEHRFALKGQPDGHESIVRFSWDLVSNLGTRVAGGTDIVKLDTEGKLAEVIGFLD